jgi:hypothetical protein
MKVLVAGDWHSDLHEAEVCKSLRRLGHEALEFKWFHYFQFDPSKPHSVSALSQRLQNKFVFGPLISRLNDDFLSQVRFHKPDLIFVYRGTHLTPTTLRSIRKELPDCKLIGYNNDDPFSPTQPRYLWRYFTASIPVYDLMLAYRHANLDDLRRAGANKTDLLRSWFVPDRNYPANLTELDRVKYATDVTFVGHYEDDLRLECLEGIVESGVSLKLYGPGYDWDPVIKNSKFLSSHVPVNLVWAHEYNKALSGAKIALCFLSKLNRDTYTRRCFEIPATRTLLMSEYSDDLAQIYKEDEEIVFFRNKFELLDKIEYYINNPEALTKVANAGFMRVYADGHDIDTRINSVLEKITN